jgi:hypothetical protein
MRMTNGLLANPHSKTLSEHINKLTQEMLGDGQ